MFDTANPRATRRPPPKATLIGSGRGKAPKAQPPGRACLACGVPLSIYNPQETCWLHSDPLPFKRTYSRRSAA